MHNPQNEEVDNTESLFEGFASCGRAARLISEHEEQMYQENILSITRSFDHIPTLERSLFELASDPHLTAGVYYTLTTSSTVDGKRNYCARDKIFLKQI